LNFHRGAADRLWGAQTQRSLEFSRSPTERMPTEIVHALAAQSSRRPNGCARQPPNSGLLPADKATAIVAAAEEVLAGRHAEEFPLSVWQTGSGTQSNMNVNEVLANRASELLGGERGQQRLVHANDDVNLGQSSNDVFPTPCTSPPRGDRARAAAGAGARCARRWRRNRRLSPISSRSAARTCRTPRR
jgi:fumarate hydratase class II